MLETCRELSATDLLDAIASTQSMYVRGRPPREVFDHLLQTLLSVTRCGYGFVAEVEYDAAGAPRLRTHAISNIAWNEETRAHYARYEAEGLVFANLETLFGRVLRSGETLISNDPGRDPRRGGLPPGHPPMHSFLGVPLKAGDTLVGMIGLANRPGGFDEALPRQLKPLLATSAQIIQAVQLDRERQRALAEVLDKRAQLKALIDTAVDAVLVMDPEGVIEEANPAAARLFDQPPEALPGLPVSTLMAERPAPSLASLAAWCAAHPEHPALQLWMQRAHGERFPVELSLAPFEVGARQRYAAILRDHSDRYHAERLLREGEARHQAIAQVALDCIIGMDAEGRIIDFNPAAERTFGWRYIDVYGRLLSDCLMPPEHRAAHQSGLQRYLKHGQSRMLGRRIEVEAMAADGRRFPVELSVVATRLDGKPFFVSYLRDISEARASREAIEQSAAELAAVLELSPDGYLVFGADGRCSRLNAAGAALTGLSIDSILGLDVDAVDGRLLDATGLSGPWPGLAALVDGDQGELRFARPRPAIVRYAHRLLQGPDGSPLGRALQWRDITLQTELDRMKSEFLATAAHELRTPLTAIHGFIELLLTRDFDAETRLDLLSTMQRESSRMVALLGDLLDLARIEARRGSDFRIAMQPLATLLEESLVGFPLPAGRQPIERPTGEPGIELPMDRLKLTQALHNLLSNACKYSPVDRPVRLTVQVEDPDRIGISVSDEGSGIPRQLHERVFERFFRADQSGQVAGTGLGLALVREIIGLHGGSVSLDSEPGRGTTVTLWLPRRPVGLPATDAAVPEIHR